jgi:hypothetical protein
LRVIEGGYKGDKMRAVSGFCHSFLTLGGWSDRVLGLIWGICGGVRAKIGGVIVGGLGQRVRQCTVTVRFSLLSIL